MAYIDYDFYRNVYHGNAIAAEDFPRLSERASDYIRAATQGVSDQMCGWQAEAVQKCACAIADILLDEEIMTASAYSGEQQASSETVGGWSRSYRSLTASTAEMDVIKNRKAEALMLYLGNLPALSGLFKVRSYSCVHRAR